MNAIVTLSKWGESLGIRIPKAIIQSLQLREGEKIDVSLQEGEISLRPTKNLAWLMEGIDPESRHDLILDDTPVGREVC